MGFSFRRSISIGPLRINFSKNGIGFSVGVRGLRVGANKNGTYVSASANGFSYRKQFKNSQTEPKIDTPKMPWDKHLDAAKQYHFGIVRNATSIEELFSDEINIQLAEKEYRIAADLGSWEACTALANGYKSGPFTINAEESERWNRAAAELGNFTSNLALSIASLKRKKEFEADYYIRQFFDKKTACPNDIMSALKDMNSEEFALIEFMHDCIEHKIIPSAKSISLLSEHKHEIEKQLNKMKSDYDTQSQTAKEIDIAIDFYTSI